MKVYGSPKKILVEITTYFCHFFQTEFMGDKIVYPRGLPVTKNSESGFKFQDISQAFLSQPRVNMFVFISLK